ncbi:alpha/beta fold hydrolase [Pirellulimonas nuda]|uniref:alpha/beta fold hydrolase n=1 Tax=Pirellulimonas nuda TaxID=2528009 RepID=UPI0011A9D9EC|nr:alpha/beta fold hydrolase [Pirellulimonas nuda]
MILLLMIAVGCASRSQWVTLRATPRNPLAESIRSVHPRGPQASDRTQQLLRRYDLVGELDGDRSALVARLAGLATTDSLHEHQYAMSELAYLGAKRAEGRRRTLAVELYGTSLLHAYEYLFDPADGVACNPYDPQFRGACDLYNQSLEGLLRLVQEEGDLRPGDRRTIQTTNHTCSFDVELKSTGWHAEDLNNFLFVSDYEVNGLRNHYHTYGLGVPLIAVRQAHGDGDVAEQFYPNNLCFPLTAFLRIDRDTQPDQPGIQVAERDKPRAPRFVLELHDPLDRQTLAIGAKQAPLETDLSTPLAYFLNQPEFQEKDISTLGLLRPDELKAVQGLYMLEPYDPNKMPVVMVHGLWSSPATWMEMFNDLRSEPLVRQHYQFWFYLYPTGQPFWESAAQFRGDLADMRRRLDPDHRLPALDQTVLVGHSMGGLVSKLQTVDSGDQFWRTNTDQPFAELDADPDVREALAESYFFRPSPSVRRVVTIGTPHRGSDFANGFTRWVSAKLIDAPMQMLNGQRQLFARNGDYFRPNSSLAIRTSVDSLDPKSPWLPVLASADPGPWVDYHNIVGRVPENTFQGFLTREGDGIVAIESARLDGQSRLKSQVVVPADHLSVHRHPQSILEVRRILFEQVADLQSPTFGLHEAVASGQAADGAVSTASAETPLPQ